MRIAFITNNYTPYSGGVVSSIQATVQELQKQGHEVCVITLSFLKSHNDDPAWVHRVPSFIRFCYKQNRMAIPWFSNYYVSKLLDTFQPEVVHVHHPFLLGCSAVRWAERKNIKTVFTYHTLYSDYVHYVPLPSWIVKRVVQRLVSTFCKTVDHIIVPSNTIQKRLSKQGMVTKVLPSGLQEQFSRQPFMKKEFKKPYQLLYVGRFTKEKNIPFLFDVLIQLPETYKLTLVGYGECTESLKWEAYKRFSNERVAFVIKPEKERLIKLYCKAYLFLFPSQTDTQGLVVAESMACSTPVIALDGPGQRDTVNGKNGIIVSTAGQMVQAILSIDSSKYDEMQRAAYQTAKRYEPAQLVTELISLYRAE